MRSFNNNLNYRHWYLDDSGVLHPMDDMSIETTGTVTGSNIINGDGINKITVGTVEPTSPATGDVWLDTS